MKSDYFPYRVESDIICPHNGFISIDIPNECDKYILKGTNRSHISDFIVSDVGYSHSQRTLSRISSQLHDKSEGTASFSEAVREAVCPDIKFARAENSHRVQDYPNECEANAYFPFDCFASESSLD